MSLEDEAAIAMDMVFNQFKRNELVTFYKSASEVVVSEEADWNADFGNPYANNIVKTSQSIELECRVIWNPQGEYVKHIEGEENINVKTGLPLGGVLIQVKQEGFEWLKEAKSFWIKGDKYTRHTDWEGIGILGDVNRYQLNLKKNQ